MKSSGIFVVFLGLQTCQVAIADSLFRCEVNGRVEFTDRRCQPVKPVCSQKDGKEPQQCATPAPGTDKPLAVSPAAPARTSNGAGWPAGRLAFNETASSTESRPRAADTR